MSKKEAEKIRSKTVKCPYCGSVAKHFGTVRHDDYKCTNPECERFISHEKIKEK